MPRAWVEFVDPQDPEQVFRCDLTFLTSAWTCVFGSACQGLYADRPDDGCCTLGAHFAEPADEERVAAAVAELTDADWQFRRRSRRGGWACDDGDDRVTRLVDGACIFLNRPGFAGGAGCALHSSALRRGVSPVTTKPDVCWQLPLRRVFEERESPDGRVVSLVTITEYERAGWGPGGHDFHWYCSANIAAHVGRRAVWESCRDELTALIGAAAYQVLAGYCRTHADHPIAPHPATVLARQRDR